MNEIGFDRRSFLRRSAAVSLTALTALDAPRYAFAGADAKTAADLIAGKDPRLIVHGSSPQEFETPLDLLAEHAITPKQLLFIRNNQSLLGSETLTPAVDPAWTIEITGLVERPVTFKVGDLASLEKVEHELVLQCSGNGRAMFSAVAPSKGAPWQCGAMGNVRFSGVPLAKLLEHLQVKVDPRANFLTAEGRDIPAKPGEADFEHSLPLADCLARSIIALEMNGESLPAAHGGPVRLVTPGYYATMNVKWLGRLRFDATETANYHQVRRYRTPKEPIAPGSEFAYGLANSDPNWRMRLKSVIFAPLADARVAAGKVEVRGVAWNDGTARIETVLVASSPDGPWQPARVDRASSPYAWQPWSTTLTLPAGEHLIVARAIDEFGRSQPLSAAAQWNPAGYAFSGVHHVRVTAA